MRTPPTLATLLRPLGLAAASLGLAAASLGLAAAPTQAQQAAEHASSPLESISLSGLFYLSYQNGEESGESFNRFRVTRSYLTAQAQILPRLTGRITVDSHQDAEGSMMTRLKYAYGKYNFGDWRSDWGTISGLGLEGGLVHMVWLDFEEHVDLYRMRSPMFMERSGMFNSADFGLALSGGLGESLPEEYRETVSSAYASRYGSFAVGVFNGGGYHAAEENNNKVLEGRLTLRPLPDRAPGLQVSGLAIVGKGNRPGPVDEVPDWRAYNAFLSYQHPTGTVTVQYAWGRGNQSGSWTEPGNPGVATDYDGYSLFAEERFGKGWRVIAGFDDLSRSPGALDLGFQQVYGGIGYDLGRQNILLLDLDRREWNDPDRPVDTHLQVVMQVKF